MQVTNALALSALISGAFAGCYSGGQTYQDKDDASMAAKLACESELSNDFGPEYEFNWVKSACANTLNGKINFVVTHVDPGNVYLSPADCHKNLQREIYGCDHGGESDYGDFAYKYVFRERNVLSCC